MMTNATVRLYEWAGSQERSMNPLIAIVLLAAPFVVLGGVVALLTVTLGRATGRPQ
jgi:hypothetical protein